MSQDKDKDGYYVGTDVPASIADPNDNDASVKPAPTVLGTNYTGVAASNPYVTVSDKREVAAEINNAIVVMFGESKAPAALIQAYYNELRALQASRSNKRYPGKSGTDTLIEGVSSQERQDILNKYLTQFAQQKVQAAATGDPKAVASLQKGNFGLTYTTLKNAYAENGVTFNEKTLAQQVTQAAVKPDTLKATLNLINLQAKTLFPALADKIDKGYTVKQLLSPYIQSRANILEEDPDTVDIKGLSSVAKDPKGLMNLYDYEISLRKDPKWRFTKNANDSIGNVARTIATTFGLMG